MTHSGALGPPFTLGTLTSSRGPFVTKGSVDSGFRGSLSLATPLALYLGPHLAPGAHGLQTGWFPLDLGAPPALELLRAPLALGDNWLLIQGPI